MNNQDKNDSKELENYITRICNTTLEHSDDAVIIPCPGTLVKAHGETKDVEASFIIIGLTKIKKWKKKCDNILKEHPSPRFSFHMFEFASHDCTENQLISTIFFTIARK